MTSFPGAPKLLKGGFIEMDAAGNAVLRTVAFQYNPETLTRSLTPRSAAAEGGDRVEALRLTGPPVETLRLEVVLDATDRLEKPAQNPLTVAEGISADLAELEMMITPKAADITAAAALAGQGVLEILPLPSPLLVLVLGRNRTLPVRVTEFSVTEEAFDQQLNPILARITLGLRVLGSDDLAPGSKGAELFLAALRRKEKLATRRMPGLQVFGLSGAP
ncbi:hypothetical protein [Pseudogemmobacter bohemicus]|uniref:hypothetical protein n=1 Tax=Pseudogemmobacter bohemicus TaxID=2250708 RepID=UPI000DD3EDAF|nr:hypothetical protein [Pseudogemmobacter bohemicus]